MESKKCFRQSFFLLMVTFLFGVSSSLVAQGLNPLQVQIRPSVLKKLEEWKTKERLQAMVAVEDGGQIPVAQSKYGETIFLYKKWEPYYAYVRVGYDGGHLALRGNWIIRCDEKSCEWNEKIDFILLEEKSKEDRLKDEIAEMAMLMQQVSRNRIKRILIEDSLSGVEYKWMVIDYYSSVDDNSAKNQAGPIHTNNTFARIFTCDQDIDQQEFKLTDFQVSDHLRDHCQFAIERVRKETQTIETPFLMLESYDEFFKDTKNEAAIREINHLVFAYVSWELGMLALAARLPQTGIAIGGTALNAVSKPKGYLQLKFGQQILLQYFNFFATSYLDLIIDPLSYWQQKNALAEAKPAGDVLKTNRHRNNLFRVAFRPTNSLHSIQKIYKGMSSLSRAACRRGVGRVNFDPNYLESDYRRTLLKIDHFKEQIFTGSDISQIEEEFKPYAFTTSLRVPAKGYVGPTIKLLEQWKCEYGGSNG